MTCSPQGTGGATCPASHLDNSQGAGRTANKNKNDNKKMRQTSLESLDVFRFFRVLFVEIIKFINVNKEAANQNQLTSTRQSTTSNKNDDVEID